MEQRLSFVTLAVDDLAASRRFYVDGLGWTPSFEGAEILMLPVGPGLTLSLWSRPAFEAECGPTATADAPLTLAHNVGSRAEVDAVLAEATAAGATLVRVAEPREWGGYSGYVADPDGYRWEIAHDPTADAPA
ncbi:VOC family protein [Nocardioides sp. TRM66260-LWL]|uniref:VOC family protein n=1 Tax=Nocardioides sp. TRM66260-LWL TaxID=2874478 RepID=UPI001CC3C730|nr:VOC family protein [Nocardioides sp. TRM66260-LWL]MBZ5733087.1 VOC family protein [Nocardioides sp. TRM66260-LWL]